MRALMLLLILAGAAWAMYGLYGRLMRGRSADAAPTTRS
jgi:hypothetical protein